METKPPVTEPKKLGRHLERFLLLLSFVFYPVIAFRWAKQCAHLNPRRREFFLASGLIGSAALGIIMICLYALWAGDMSSPLENETLLVGILVYGLEFLLTIDNITKLKEEFVKQDALGLFENMPYVA